MNHDVFISYSSADNKIAFELCGMLESSDINCWIAPRDVSGGKSYAREIIEAISGSHVVLFIFSSNSNRSPHVENEIDAAFNAGKIIIPFRIEDVPMSPELAYYLNKKHHIDGILSPSSKYEELKKCILNNLPKLHERNNGSNYFMDLSDKIVKRKKCGDCYIEIMEINPDFSTFVLSESKGQKPQVEIFRRIEDDVIDGFRFSLSPWEKKPEKRFFLLEDEGSRAMYFRNAESYITFFKVGDKRSGLHEINEINVFEAQITNEFPDDNIISFGQMIPIVHIKNIDEILK